MRLLALAALIAAATWADTGSAAYIVFDDFNTNEGHFNQAPSFSGSNSNVAATSTADRVENGPGVDSWEGIGHEKIVINTTTAGNSTRLRFLSGSGTPANNTSFAVGAGEDGFLGFVLKTDSPGWTVQPWIEGPENNGGVPRAIIADNQWHFYEWDLDDESGGPSGWGAVAGIVAGDADVQAGNYTIDSLVFRNTAGPASAMISLDFVAKSDSGSFIPEPAALVLVGLGVLSLSAVRRRIV